MKPFIFFNHSHTTAFLLLTFLFASEFSIGQNFQMHYGTALDNSFSKVVKDGDGFYVLGSNEVAEDTFQRATVTRLDINGQHQWTLSMNSPSRWADAVLMPGGDLLVVGYSLPLDASAKSLFGRVTQGGTFGWLKTYDEPGRDFFNRIVEQAGSYYVLAGETEFGGSFDNVALWNFSTTGILNWKKYYISDGDDEFVRDLVAIPGGGLLMAGNDAKGVIYTTDNAGEMTTTAISIANRIYRDVEANSSDGFYAAATNFPSGEAFLQKLDFSLLLQWEVQIQELNSISQVWEGLPGDLYVTGTGTFGDQLRNVIIKLTDDPTNGPSVDWVKYLHAGTGQTGGSAWYLAPLQLAYSDARILPGGFGQSCANLSVSSLDMTDACEVTEDAANLLSTDPVPDGPPTYSAEQLPPSNTGEITESSSLNWQQGVTCSNEPETGSITGVKYLECDELPYTDQQVLSGWVIELLNDIGEVIALDTTDNDGVYRINDVPPGLYTVQEVAKPPGWTPKFPASGRYESVVVNQGSQVVLNFGNCPIGSITGVKYVECDELPYTDQQVLSGWVIELLNDIGEVIAQDTTDNDGVYRLNDVPTGLYTVQEVAKPPGWTPNFPLSGRYESVEVNQGSQVVLNFGNCPIGSITGVKYVECDELPYTDQQVLPGWIIELLNDTGEVISLDTTDDDGAYSFNDVPVGIYNLREAAQPGWTPKVPASGQYAMVAVDQGSQVVRNFGNCSNCYCGGFSDMFIRIAGAPSQQVFCDSSLVVLDCPNTGFGYILTGVQRCEGDSCPIENMIEWNLTGPNNFSHSDSFTDNDQYWGIKLLPTFFTQSGFYTLTLTGHCGSNECPCIIEFEVNCPNLCPCEQSDIDALEVKVGKGFATSLSNNTCKACFSPIALSECETVEWFLNSSGGTPIGTSKGEQTFCTTFTAAGTYNVIMVVNRKKADGSTCEVFTKSQSVTVTCGKGQDCNISVLENSGFNVSPVPGGLGAGGMGSAPGWEATVGNPVLLEGQTDSHDAWSMMLTGNYDEADVQSSVETICISKTDTGTISLRLAGEPIPGVSVKVGRKPPCGPLTIILYQVGTVPYPNCTGGGCYELATMVDLLPLDTNDWYEVNIPFNLGDWTALDTCEDVTGGVPVRLAVYVSNYLSDEQGDGPTRDFVQVDNICLDGKIISAVLGPAHERGFQLFPNPTTGSLNIEFNSHALPGQCLRITDLTGLMLMETPTIAGATQQVMPTSELPGGLYFLQVTYKGKVLAVEKFLKQ